MQTKPGNNRRSKPHIRDTSGNNALDVYYPDVSLDAPKKKKNTTEKQTQKRKPAHQNTPNKTTKKQKGHIRAEIEKKKEKSRKKKERARKKRERADRLWNEMLIPADPVVPFRATDARTGRLSVIFLSIICTISLVICMQFLYLKASYTRQMQKVNKAERDLTQVQSENEAYQKDVEASVTLDEVLEYAIDQLGMHYPSIDEIKYYSEEQSNYVRQYTDVPKS